MAPDAAIDHRTGFPAEVRAFERYDDGHWLRSQPCDVLFAEYAGGTELPPHQHDDVDIVGVVTQGHVRLTIDGDERSYRPGQWFKVPAAVEHSAVYVETTLEVELFFPVGAAPAEAP